jgi:RNA polymerase sigma-70 factor (ECF subfamily)
LFDLLVQLYPSPVAMLNRAVVLAENGNVQQAIAAVLHIPGIELLLQTQHLYSAVLGDLYAKLSEQVKALEYFQQAQSLTRSQAEQKLLHQKIAALKRE